MRGCGKAHLNAARKAGDKAKQRRSAMGWQFDVQTRIV